MFIKLKVKDFFEIPTAFYVYPGLCRCLLKTGCMERGYFFAGLSVGACSGVAGFAPAGEDGRDFFSGITVD